MGSKFDNNISSAFHDENSIQERRADSDDDGNDSDDDGNDSAISGHKVKDEEEEEGDGEREAGEEKEGEEEGEGESEAGEEEEEEEEKDESSVGSMWTTNSGNGEDYTAHDSTSNSVTEMDDSLDSTWTDDKHSSYLSSIEASFVEQMYEKKYFVLDIHGQTPKQNESSDPNCAESRANFLKPINKFKVLQKGCWLKLNYNRAWHLGVSTPRAVLANPWIQHFIPAPCSKGHEVPSRTVNLSCGEHEIAAVGVSQINALESKHSFPIKTVHRAFPDANEQLHVQHHRIGYKFADSNSTFGKTETRHICTQEVLVHPRPVSDKGDNMIKEANMERNHIDRLIKKQKMKMGSISCSDRDQVVPLLQSSNLAGSGDSISKLNHKKPTSPNWNDNNMPVTLDKWLTENDGCSSTQENTSLHIRQESAVYPVIKKSSSFIPKDSDFHERKQSHEEIS